ncbi:DNA damage-binding protein 1, partial [Rhizophlyctis rosea]
MFYVATARRPDSVVQCVKGNFTGPDDLNLIVCKATHLEIYVVVDDPANPDAKTIRPVMDHVLIYGRIAAVELYKPASSSTPLLFLLTLSQKYSILTYNAAQNTLDTLCTGDLTDRTGRPSEEGVFASVDPTGGMIVAHLYSGWLRVLPVFGGEGKGKRPASAAGGLVPAPRGGMAVGEVMGSFNV